MISIDKYTSFVKEQIIDSHSRFPSPENRAIIFKIPEEPIMVKRAFALLAAVWSFVAYTPAMADTYGKGIEVIGTTKQISATTNSSSVLMGTESNYIYAHNEGTGTAYVTCIDSTATVPGTAGPDSFPLASGESGILHVPTTSSYCAAITATSTATVDFTPINLF